MNKRELELKQWVLALVTSFTDRIEDLERRLALLEGDTSQSGAVSLTGTLTETLTESEPSHLDSSDNDTDLLAAGIDGLNAILSEAVAALQRDEPVDVRSVLSRVQGDCALLGLVDVAESASIMAHSDIGQDRVSGAKVGAQLLALIEQLQSLCGNASDNITRATAEEGSVLEVADLPKVIMTDLTELGEVELVMLRSFVAGLGDRIVAIEDAEDQQNWGFVYSEINRLVGDAMICGYPLLAATGREIQQFAETTELEAMIKEIAKLKLIYRAIVRGLASIP